MKKNLMNGTDNEGRFVIEPGILVHDDPMNSSMLKAILTDSHFWIPVGVLIFGISVLLAVK